MNHFSVNHGKLEIKTKEGYSLDVSINKDEAHSLLRELERYYGRPQEVTREEILAPEKISFLEDSDGN